MVMAAPGCARLKGKGRMSLARLFLSGLLIAWGLILGAFTLHGYFDPNWLQRQMQAANVREAAKAPSAINEFRRRNRFVASRVEQPQPVIRVAAPASNNGPGEIKAEGKVSAKP